MIRTEKIKGEIMVKILLLSHGKLCREMLETMKLIVGDVPEVSTILQKEDGDMNRYEEEIYSFLNSSDSTLVITDLYGGSPLLTATKVYSRLPAQKQAQVRIVTGMNLGMLLELHNSLDLPLEELSAKAVESGQKGITDFIREMRRNQE